MMFLCRHCFSDRRKKANSEPKEYPPIKVEEVLDPKSIIITDCDLCNEDADFRVQSFMNGIWQ